MKEEKIGINNFVQKNSGVFTLMGIFLIFVTISPNFLSTAENFKMLSQDIWLGGMMLLIFCLINLTYKIYMEKENSESLKIFFGAPLILITFPIVLFFVLSIFQNEQMLNFFSGMLDAFIKMIFVILGLIIVLSPNKIPLKNWRWISYAGIFLLGVLLILFTNWRDNFWFSINNLSIWGWLTYSVIIGGIFEIVNKTIKKRLRT